MLFQLNFKSAKAVYLQLVDQVKAASASGVVRAGDPLPGIRPLAEELRVNRNTVAKAYAELESQGIIETLAGKGCFVRLNGSPFRKDVRRKLLAERRRQYEDVMSDQVPAIETKNLVRRYGRTDGGDGVTLRVARGPCY